MGGPVVVILAAGQGTRMRSALPKLLHPLCGRPIVAWTIAAAQAAGARRIVLVDSPERHLAELAASLDGVQVAVQPQPDGTAGALAAAAAHLDADDVIVVANGDGPLLRAETLRGLLDAHGAAPAAATLVTMTPADPTGYGRVVRAPDGTVERVVETKAAGDASEQELRIREVSSGLFAFDGGPMLEALARVGSDNAQGERYLPDVLPALRGAGHTVNAFSVPDPDELLGINDRVQLAQVAGIAQRRICERHMRAGVTIVNPAATVIEFAVEIGADTTIEPFTQLRGATRIGSGTVIGAGTTLQDATVGDGASVLHAHVLGAEIGDRVSVGPFAYLRPGTVLREGSKAGTFVEIKNSEVGAGSKVPHLSYIGDATIGEDTNLGAATITANYDGVRKHRTHIGNRVHTAVDTTFVAPVRIGDDGWTGAGSVITHDVPDGGLGVARARQRNIDGYAERRAARDEEGS